MITLGIEDTITYQDLVKMAAIIKGDPPMNEMEIYILGHAIKIKFQIHDRGYIAWKLSPEKWLPEHDLLDVLLRIHCQQLIESYCREEAHYQHYAANAQYDDRMDSYRYAMGPYKKPEEDIPF